MSVVIVGKHDESSVGAEKQQRADSDHVEPDRLNGHALLLDGQITLDLSLVDAVNRNPGKVSADQETPNRVASRHVGVEAEK